MSTSSNRPSKSGTDSEPAGIISVGALEIDVTAGRVRLAGQPVPLTELEFRVLLYLARNRGRVVPASEQLDAVWRYKGGAGGTTDQVRSCIKRLREKIEADPHHPVYIVTAYGQGYFMPSQIGPKQA